MEVSLLHDAGAEIRGLTVRGGRGWRLGFGGLECWVWGRGSRGVGVHGMEADNKREGREASGDGWVGLGKAGLKVDS